MLSHQILLSPREDSLAQSSLFWWILPPHLDVWDTGSPSSITLQPHAWSLDWGSWQFCRSDRSLIVSEPRDGVNHPQSLASSWNHGNGQNTFTWSECVTLWVCTWLQSLCLTVDEQSLFPCNWSFHLLPWYSHVTEQIFNYLWLGQQRPPGHCRHLERISPAYMRLVSPCAVSADGEGSLQFLWMSRWKFEIPRLRSLALLMAFACQMSCHGYRFKWSYKMPSAFPWPSWSLTRRDFGWASLLEKRVLQLVWIPWEGR